jgi:hypothetical protein
MLKLAPAPADFPNPDDSLLELGYDRFRPHRLHHNQSFGACGWDTPASNLGTNASRYLWDTI